MLIKLTHMLAVMAAPLENIKGNMSEGLIAKNQTNPVKKNVKNIFMTSE
jgi:hypothetical protein